MSQAVREARLKPQFAGLYPSLAPNVWRPASQIAGDLLRYVVQHAGAEFRLPVRVLSEEHFDFRGGAASEAPRRPAAERLHEARRLRAV